MKYRLADGASDYTLCKELIDAENFDAQDLEFPTVMAIDDDGEVVGLLATSPHPEMVLAGPLVMRHDRRRPRTAIQLIQLYETTMRGLGIQSFVFATDERYGFLQEGIKRYFPDIRPYATEGNVEFYIWPLSKVAQEA